MRISLIIVSSRARVACWWLYALSLSPPSSSPTFSFLSFLFLSFLLISFFFGRVIFKTSFHFPGFPSDKNAPVPPWPRLARVP